MTAYGTIDHEGAESAVTERKARRIALAFRRDDAMELRLALREHDPEAFAALPRDEQMGTAYYGLARAAATQVALEDEDALDEPDEVA